MKPIRTLIVDDEPLARKRINRLLGEHPEINVVGEARNGAEAIEIIRSKNPELVFMDIQMPDMDGFAVIRQIEKQDLPIIIFVTAYDQYALKAFEVHAVDYLLKPFDNDRFNEALSLAKDRVKLDNTKDFNQKLMDLMRTYQHDAGSYLRSFSIKKNGKHITIPVNDLFWLESSGNYLSLHSQDREELYRGTMNAIEAELDPTRFLRIHRSYTLNVDRIKKVTYLNNNEYKFIMDNDAELISGRSYKEKIMLFLSESGL